MSLQDRAWQLGVTSLYLICLGAFLSPVLISAASILLVLAFASAGAASLHGLKSPIVAAVLLFFVFATVRAIVGASGINQDYGGSWVILWDWLKLLLLLPFAVFLDANHQRFGRLLIVALVGFILGILRQLDWGLAFSDPVKLLTDRHGYGFTAIGFALLAGCGVIGLVVLRSRWWANMARKNLEIPGLLAWFGALVLMAYGFAQSQSRAAWLAIVVATAAGFVISRVASRPLPAHARSRKWVIMVMLAGALIAALNYTPGMVQRWSTDFEAVHDLVTGELSDVSSSSLGLRWHAHLAGIQFFKEHPIIGWGPVDSRELMSKLEDAHLVTEGDGKVLQHLHNTYLEVLVQFGALGLLIFLVGVAALFYSVWHGMKSGRLPKDYAVFLITAMTFSLVWAMFNFRALTTEWGMHWMILAGAALSWSIATNSRFSASHR